MQNAPNGSRNVQLLALLISFSVGFGLGSFLGASGFQQLSSLGSSSNLAQVASVGSIKVTAPNGGETLSIGSSAAITWQATGFTQVRLTIWQNGAFRGDIAIVPNNGSYLWIVPERLPPGTGYKIRVRDPITGVAATTFDDSDATFTIKSAFSLAAVTPPASSPNLLKGGGATAKVSPRGATYYSPIPETNPTTLHPNYAIDGITTATNLWCSDNSTVSEDWLRAELAVPQVINQVIVYQASSSPYTCNKAVDYKIQTSMDGVNWTTQVSITGNTQADVSHTFAATQARYVRFYSTKLPNVSAARLGIRDIQAYGPLPDVVISSFDRQANGLLRFGIKNIGQADVVMPTEIDSGLCYSIFGSIATDGGVYVINSAGTGAAVNSEPFNFFDAVCLATSTYPIKPGQTVYAEYKAFSPNVDFQPGTNVYLGINGTYYDYTIKAFKHNPNAQDIKESSVTNNSLTRTVPPRVVLVPAVPISSETKALIKQVVAQATGPQTAGPGTIKIEPVGEECGPEGVGSVLDPYSNSTEYKITVGDKSKTYKTVRQAGVTMKNDVKDRVKELLGDNATTSAAVDAAFSDAGVAVKQCVYVVARGVSMASKAVRDIVTLKIVFHPIVSVKDIFAKPPVVSPARVDSAGINKVMVPFALVGPEQTEPLEGELKVE